MTKKLMDENEESVRGFRWAVDDMERKMHSEAELGLLSWRVKLEILLRLLRGMEVMRCLTGLYIQPFQALHLVERR